MKNALILFLGIFCSITVAQIPTNGLVAHFPFNGNANDGSGNGYNGEVYGATLTTDRFGNANSAYSFDGVDDFIWASFVSVLNGSGESTFSCWYQTDLGFSIGSGTLLGHWKNDGQYNGPIGQQISIFNDGSFNFSLIGGQGVASGLNLAPTSNWHKVDFVYNGSLPIDSRIALYCDGQFAQYIIMGNAPTQIGVQATRTYLGAACGPDGADDAWSHFKGKMDDVLLYNRALTSAEISELYQNQSTNIPSLTCSITSSTDVLCSGESSQLTVSTNQVNLNNAWTQLGNLDVPIHAGAGTIYNGKIIVAAGADQVSNQLLVRTFDLSSLQSATINATIPHWVGEPGFGFFNEKLYVIGGYNGAATNYNQSFDLNSLTWTLNASMPTMRSVLSSAQIEDGIYVLGGWPGEQPAFERYNALNNTWEILPNIPTPRHSVNTAAAINGKVYFFAGKNASLTTYFDKNEMYDPVTNIWVEKSPTPFANYGAAACAHNGKIYVLGGATGTYQEAVNGAHTLSNKLWIYTPETDSWVEGASFPEYIHLAQLLSDGNDLYCVGGICSQTPSGIKYTSSAVYKLGVGYSNSYAWNIGETSSSITVTPTTTTTYSCTVTRGSQTCTASVNIIVNPNITNDISASIVEGESYTFGAQTLTTAGTYSEVFTSATGCDSTVILTLSIVTPCLPNYLPTNGLVGYWPFCGNANDESGGGNHATLNNASFASDRFNQENLALEMFGGGQGASTTNIMNAWCNNALSAAFWVNFNTGMNASTSGSVFGRQNFIANDYFSNNGQAPFQIYFAVNNSIVLELFDADMNVYFYTFQIPNLSENQWYHIAFTAIASSSVIFYVNGVGENLGTSPTTFRNGNTRICFGYEVSYVGPNALNGKLDDIGIWNRVLTAQEIQSLYLSEQVLCVPTSSEFSETIISGQTYTLGTQTLTTAGTYTEVFTSAAGCDSTVTLTLTIEPLLTCSITVPVTSICEGESVTLSMNTTGGSVASSQLPYNLQQGLVAYYPFNGNANDESGNGNDGVVNGATLISDRFGSLNSAYKFDYFSGDGIQGVNNGLPQGNNPVTISGWFKLDSYPTNWDSYSIFSYGTWQALKARFTIIRGNFNFSGKKLAFGLYENDFDVDFEYFTDTWYHYAAVNSLDTAYLYVNGSLIGKEFIGAALTTGYGFQIGRAMSNDSFMDGIIDDVCIYNRALSPAEIQQLYTAQSFAWSTGATTPSINVSPTETTTYTATVTTATQSCTDSITIMVNPLFYWYADADGDGFGDANNVVQDCNQPDGFVTDNSDCNDDDAQANPVAEEICDNQMDDNCDGQVDENCAILGCTDPSACNFDPVANTDDGSCILPQPEICDGLDNNCNNQIDEGLSPASINAVTATTALYPVCSGNSIRSANLNNGVNSPAIEGDGNDLWYSFTALFNTFRAGLSAASGDNDLRLFTITAGGCLSLIETEHETTSGNQTLLTDQLTVGQTYYVAVHNISGPMNTSAKICFNHLNASSCDHYYSNNTGIYTSVCSSFKAQYRANAVAYTFEILSAAQNSVNQNITPWSYTTPTSNTVVARLGTLLPANQGTSPIVYTMRVPVLYSLFDAAGNFENLYAQATSTCTTTINAEPTIALRSSDRCPTNKSITSTIAPDRTVCGAMRYDWEFTEVLPNPGTAQVVQGGAYSSAFFLSNIPGVASGKTYNVRVRPVHTSGTTGNWGAVHCLRIGNAGMIVQSENQNESDAGMESRVSSISIYPNPTATGSFVLQYNGTRRGESIFAQEPTTTESTFAQELIMLDITGKEVFRQQVVLNGNSVEVQFGDLSSGLYFVSIGKYRMRLEVMP